MNMNKIEPERYENRNGMMLAGIRQFHHFSNASETIPKQWVQFSDLGVINTQVGTTRYGAVCSSNTEGFEYLSGVEVDSFSDLPEKLGKMIITDQNYAVFVHHDHISTIKNTWELILNDWLPRSKIHVAEAPNFERYDERFDPSSGLGVVEIFIPIVS